MTFHDCPRTTTLDSSQTLQAADQTYTLLWQAWHAGPRNCHFIVWMFASALQQLRTVSGMN